MENDNTIKQLEQILGKKQKYVVKTDANRRDLSVIKVSVIADADGTLADVTTKFNALLVEARKLQLNNNVLATLINDFKKQGIVK